MLPPIDEILANFEFLDDWDERYRYLIELGRMLPALPEEARTDRNKVQGCASQVWLVTDFECGAGHPRLEIVGDSDAHIVRGLVAILIALYRGKSPEVVARLDPAAIFKDLGLSEHLTPQRSNGVRSMVERIRSDARSAAALS